MGQHLSADPRLASDHPQLPALRDPLPAHPSRGVEGKDLHLPQQEHRDHGAHDDRDLRAGRAPYPRVAPAGTEAGPPGQDAGEQPVPLRRNVERSRRQSNP